MPKPRVLLVSKLYYPWIGGVERHIQDLAESLKNEFDVKVLSCQEPIPVLRRAYCVLRKDNLLGRTTPNAELINGIPVYKAPSLGLLWSMPIAPTFPWWLKKLAQEADVLHFHLPFPLAMASWLSIHFFLKRTSHIAQRRTIITWHSDIVRQRLPNFFLKPLTKRFLKKADAIIVSSPNMLDSSQEIQDFKEKTKVIPLGIDLSKYEPTSEVLKKSQEIKEGLGDFPLVLFVGRFVPYKGLEYLLEAIKDIKSPAKFLFVGDGPLKNKLKALAAKLQIQNRVVFVEKKQGEDLVAYYHACEFLVLPSVTPNEAFGLVQVEAMACAKPVINTKLSTGVPWVSPQGETGLSVEPKNSPALAQAIEKLIADKELREAFGKNAKKRAEKLFSKSTMCQEISSLYKSLIFD